MGTIRPIAVASALRSMPMTSFSGGVQPNACRAAGCFDGVVWLEQHVLKKIGWRSMPHRLMQTSQFAGLPELPRIPLGTRAVISHADTTAMAGNEHNRPGFGDLVTGARFVSAERAPPRYGGCIHQAGDGEGRCLQKTLWEWSLAPCWELHGKVKGMHQVLRPANLGMCDEEVASRCAHAHTGTGVAVQSARRLCAVRLQLGRGCIQGWHGRW